MKMDGSQSATMDLPEKIFGIEPNEAVVHSYVVTYLNNQRQGTASTKSRSEVQGGGAKPWRQKGTGRARAGTNRSPLWPGGGIVFGPTPRVFYRRLPKKQRQLALFSAFSDKARADRIKVLETLELPDRKTRSLVSVLKNLELGDKKVLVLDEGMNPNPYFAARNIEGVKVSRARLTNAYDILNADYLVLTKAAVQDLEEVYS
jgi:large subunit ribosomal protein L4